jgi:Leucine-rich repeat (LRR) protein
MWRRKKASRTLAVIGSCSQASVAMAVRVNKSAASAGMLNMTAKRSAVPHSQRSRPIVDAKERLHSRRPFIPTDLVQNTAEYSGRVARLLSFRGVSTEWQGAVSDAVGFLNGRCWTSVEAGTYDGPLWTSLRVDTPTVVMRCAVMCLRPRLETAQWSDQDNYRCSLPLRLLGENNTTLTALTLHSNKSLDSPQLRELRGLKRLCLGAMEVEDSMVHAISELLCLEVLDLTLLKEPSRPLPDLGGLQGLVALGELNLCNTAVTNESFIGLDRLLGRLHKLGLRRCKRLTAISNLTPCASLRELDLSYSGVKHLEGLDKLVALETLTIEHATNFVKDWSVLRRCPELVMLTAEVNDDAYSAGDIQAMVDSAAHCLVRWRLHSTSRARVMRSTRAALEAERLPCFLGCTFLRELDLSFTALENASVGSLAQMSALEVLNLRGNRIDDVRTFIECHVLRDLCLGSTLVTNEGIIGLERIVTLEKLDFIRCPHLTSVTNLRHCAALRQLHLGSSPITTAGIEGLERIVTLTTLSLSSCDFITSVSTLRHSPSLRELNIAGTPVTGSGIAGLEEIGTLDQLNATGCEKLDNVTTLRRCRALRVLNLGSSNVTDASMSALACVATLETLCLSQCEWIRDVSGLSESASLRELDLRGTNVHDTGIAGLERIPTLTELELILCDAVTNVTHMARSKSLRRLRLCASGVTDAGIAGIDRAPALEFVDLRWCRGICDVAAVALRAQEHAVNLWA